ncbi:toprim domain-containing protein [uncultured Microbulbifer sp.]|uniref:toprim domain-containing protein n=1 Tax=uncultured Microbulbifer sp. TaxID=348147 RepID=UPI002620A50D|nr:toprim domain-containing protein [uncultured Microbulbifer sp.]
MAAKSIAREITPLVISYEERDQAKRLAGKLPSGENALGWDPVNKWFAKPGADLTVLRAYLPGQGTEPVNKSRTPEEEFTEILKAQGFILEDLPEMDGLWHRVPVENDKCGQASGAYRAFLDGLPAGHYQNHRIHDAPVKWVSKGRQLTGTELAEIAAKATKKVQVRNAARARQHDHHAQRCAQLWALLGTADGNEYLAYKGVRAYGVRMDSRGRLVVPLRNLQNEIRSLQRIGRRGTKRLKKRGEKAANFHLLNSDKVATSRVILLGEGYATAATLAEATGLPVVCCFDAGNLVLVAEQLRDHFPDDKGFLVVGDDDVFSERNKGRKQATKAAVLFGQRGAAVFPHFGVNLLRRTDFNDLHKDCGIEAVKKQLRPPYVALIRQMDKVGAVSDTVSPNGGNTAETVW